MSTNTEQRTMDEPPDTIALDADGAVTLPVVDVLTGRGFVTGKSGSGKSNTASVVVENLLDLGFPVMIVDTDGEYWGLKEQYEVLHVGADEECDLQVGQEHAAKLADLALEQNVPIILDVSGYLDSDEANALIRDTAKHLFDKEKRLNKPFLLVVEEIHEYLPQSGGLDATGEMLIRVAKRGRKRGLGLAGISQRPADVRKDFITQCDWLLWHRLTWDNDTDVVKRVVGSDYADDVQDLGDGEAFLQADFLEDDVVRVQVRRKETFDAGATPDLGDFKRPELKSVGGDLVGELEEISQREERRQDRIAQLEERLEEKDETIAELEEELERAQDMTSMAEQFTQALTASGGSNGGGEALQEKVEELREEKNRRIRELEHAVEDREDTIASLEDRVGELERYEERVEQLEGLNIEEAEEAVTRLADALGVGVDGDAEKWRRKYQQEREKRASEIKQPETPDVLEHSAVRRQVERLSDEVSELDEYELGMLEWYKFYGPGGAKDAYFHAGGSRQSSHVNKKNKTLREKGFVEKVGRGEYRYALDDKVREQFAENPQIDEHATEALVAEVETVMEGDNGE